MCCARTWPENLVLADWLRPKPPRVLPPDPAGVAAAVEALWSARRPLVLTGRGARDCGAELVRLLDATGAVYLDTQESRGLVPPDHPGFVGAMRAAAMTEADTVLVIGRKLDYQLGYGSPAVFPNARFLRLADNAGELVDNRRGDPELLAAPALALAAILDAAGNREPATDRAWAEGLRRRHLERSRPGSAPPARGRTARSTRRRSSTRSGRSPTPTTSPSPTAATCSASPVSAWRPAPISTPAPSAASASACPTPWRRRSPAPTAR